MLKFLLGDAAASVLARRLVTITCYSIAWAAAVVLAPIWLSAALIVDLARRDRSRPWPTVRTFVFSTSYLAAELVGVLIAFVLWLLYPALGEDRFLRANFRLQVHWGSTLFAIGSRLFGFRTFVEGAELLEERRPILLMIRHSSMADTVLAVRFVSAPHGVQLRYVLKRPLLLDPCLDIVGNRLPNWFSTHATVRRQAQLDAIVRLASDLGPRDGVLIYPEGTRFSVAKQRHQNERLRRAGKESELARAERLRHVLLPRRGGPFALLEANRHVENPADLVLCAHTGFEGSSSFAELRSGALIGADIHVRFWRYRAEQIPSEPEEQREWLLDRWQEVDDFIDRHRVIACPEPRSGDRDSDRRRDAGLGRLDEAGSIDGSRFRSLDRSVAERSEARDAAREASLSRRERR